MTFMTFISRIKIVVVVCTALLIAIPSLATAQEQGADPRPPNAPSQKPAFPGQTRAPERKTNVAFDVVPVATGLSYPWGMAFLPDGRILVTEKQPGRLRIVSSDGKISEPVAGLPAVDARDQGGLLDVALDPAFATNGLVYWSYSEPRENGINNTAVARGRLDASGAAPRVDDVQRDLSPDAVAAIGDALRRPAGVRPRRHAVRHARANARSSKGACKRSGWTARSARSCASTPTARSRRTTRSSARTASGRRSGRSATATFRLRRCNPTTGELWEVEHGTRGGDEINIPRKGKDYGWPTIAYGIEYEGPPIGDGITAKDGMEQPLYYWDPVIAPSGMVVLHRRPLSRVEGRSVHRRDGQHQPRAAHGERRARRR